MSSKFFIGLGLGFAGGIAAGVMVNKKYGAPYAWFNMRHDIANTVVKKLLGREWEASINRYRGGYQSYTSEPEHRYRVMDIFGHKALYSEVRGELEDEAFDLGYTEGNACHFYYLRGGKDDDPGQICTVEDKVVYCNYVATIMMKEPLIFNASNALQDGGHYIELWENDWGFTDEPETTVAGFMEEHAEGGVKL